MADGEVTIFLACNKKLLGCVNLIAFLSTTLGALA